MKFYADLHIHSRFSRACSKRLTLPEIYKWCQLRGVTVVGTGDFTHPVWINEIKEQLSEESEGLFKLKKEFAKKVDNEVPEKCRSEVKFLLSSEISLIYKRDDRVRKVHHVILAPSIKVVEKLISKLGAIGNLRSDGRPIIGLDSRDLLKIVLEVSDECMFIPAHIWTPWFSMFGDKSGFDSIEECFGDLSKYIYAIETGLSSDPPMNWMVDDLDNVTIISDSDAHSPENIAREANIFDCKLSYKEITEAIKLRDSRFLGTIEFYPEEGRYHYDGHRNCDIVQDPIETNKTDAVCPKCKKRLTVGVLNRVKELATREKGKKADNARPFFNVISLKEILSEVLEKGAKSKIVISEYFKLLSKFGSELSIALEISKEELNEYSPLLSEAISRVRQGRVDITPGYDGVYGVIKIFSKAQREKIKNDRQIKLI